jgi:hypothetical protein
LLDRLEAKLTPSERRVREEGFRQAREFVRTRPAEGGLDAPVEKSFPRRKLQGGIRVDLVVITGSACVADPEN